MSEALDRRQQKTRAALHAAFRDLLLDRGYEGLTIGDLTARANIGRSTFYEHYRTMDDLLRASLQRPFMCFAQLVETPAVPETLDALAGQLQHFRDNRQVARVLLTWPTRAVMTSSLTDLVAGRLRGLRLPQPLIPVELIARQVAEMQLALLESWIAGRPAVEMHAAVAALERGTRALVTALSAG
jgi:AcrR family transcriptional regulator